MSAPSVSGCCRNGVANVLSTTHQRAAARGRSRRSASMSKQRQQRIGRRLQPHHAWCRPATSAASASMSIRSTALHVNPSGATLEISRNVPPYASLPSSTRSPGVEQSQHVVLGRQSAGERQAVASVLQRRDTRLERGAGRVAAARVLESLVPADAVLGERRAERDRRDDRAGDRVGLLPGVHCARVSKPHDDCSSNSPI